MIPIPGVYTPPSTWTAEPLTGPVLATGTLANGSRRWLDTLDHAMTCRITVQGVPQPGRYPDHAPAECGAQAYWLGGRVGSLSGRALDYPLCERHAQGQAASMGYRTIEDACEQVGYVLCTGCANPDQPLHADSWHSDPTDQVPGVWHESCLAEASQAGAEERAIDSYYHGGRG